MLVFEGNAMILQDHMVARVLSLRNCQEILMGPYNRPIGD